MKAELVNLVTTHGTDMVVLITSATAEPTSDERLLAVEVTVCLVHEGWTVVTAAASPLAGIVRKGAAAVGGVYRTLEDPAHVQVEHCLSQLPPHAGRPAI